MSSRRKLAPEAIIDAARDLASGLERSDLLTRPAARAAVVISASTITPESVDWVWPGRLAIRTLTNLVGLPDQGKTLIFIDIAARLTDGSPMPPAPRRPGNRAPQRVLILTLEDSLRHTIVPRLIKARADLTLVDFVQMVRQPDGRPSFLTLAEDLDVLEAQLAAQTYALVVVDGVTGYLGETKTHNDGDVRRVLAPFAALLERQRVAGLSIMHPPKTIANLAYFAGGSVAFTAIPRVSLGVGADPNDDSENPRRVLLKIKGNLYGHVPTLAYRIVADQPAAIPWIEWEPDPVTVNIADVLDPLKETPEDRSARRACQQFLRAYLAEGPKPAREVEAAAKEVGFSSRTIDRAKSGLVDSVKRGLACWEWVIRTAP
jgi:hypothetical protein